MLDLWPQSDGWRPSAFFRRYIDEDATFEDRNFVVGLVGGRLTGCVQIFPRPVRVHGCVVPMGGIGSVFTHPEERGQGHASRLLEATTRCMLERGMELSLLFGVRRMYEAMGWKAWGATARLLSRSEAAAPALDAEPFVRERDLDEVRRLYADYSGAQQGTVVRDDRLWETSLRVAGNPHEEFLVARRAGRIVAYARAMVAESFLSVSEVGRAEGAARELAGLVAHVLTPRQGDALATPERESEALRRVAAFRPPHDPELDEALLALGVSARVVDDPTVKWRCLDAAGLARRLGVPLAPGETSEAYLRRVFPPGASVFWPSDRF